MYLYSVPLLLFSNFFIEISTTEATSSTQKPNTRKSNHDNDNCVCFPGGQSLIPEIVNPQGNGLERLVVYLYREPETNQVKLFTPSPEKQALIPNIPFTVGDTIKPVTTETVSSLIQPNSNAVGPNQPQTDGVPIGLKWGTIEQASPTPSYFELLKGPQAYKQQQKPNPTSLIFPNQKSVWQNNAVTNVPIQPQKGVNQNQPLYSWPTGINQINNPIGVSGLNEAQVPTKQDVYAPGNLKRGYLTFDQWFNKELESFNHPNSPQDIKAINTDVLRSQIQKALFENHMHIGSTGQITDANGAPIDLNNLELRPILIGNSVRYPQVKEGQEFTLPKHLPYLEGILITLVYPPKVLGVIPLGKTYVSQTGLENATPKAHIYYTGSGSEVGSVPTSNHLNPLPGAANTAQNLLNVKNLPSNILNQISTVTSPPISGTNVPNLLNTYPNGIRPPTNVINPQSSATSSLPTQLNPFSNVISPPTNLIKSQTNAAALPPTQWNSFSNGISSPANVINTQSSVTGSTPTLLNPYSSVISSATNPLSTVSGSQYPNGQWTYSTGVPGSYVYQTSNLYPGMPANLQNQNINVPANGNDITYLTVPTSPQNVLWGPQLNNVWQRRSNKATKPPKSSKNPKITGKSAKPTKDTGRSSNKGKSKSRSRSADSNPSLKNRRWSTPVLYPSENILSEPNLFQPVLPLSPVSNPNLAYYPNINPQLTNNLNYLTQPSNPLLNLGNTSPLEQIEGELILGNQQRQLIGNSWNPELSLNLAANPAFEISSGLSALSNPLWSPLQQSQWPALRRAVVSSLKDNLPETSTGEPLKNPSEGQTRRFSMSSVEGVLKNLINMVLQNFAQVGESRRKEAEKNVTKSNPIGKNGEDGDQPDFRIIGGSAATGSGSPLSNKGRSGIIR